MESKIITLSHNFLREIILCLREKVENMSDAAKNDNNRASVYHRNELNLKTSSGHHIILTIQMKILEYRVCF